MPSTRRDFLRISAAALGIASLGLEGCSGGGGQGSGRTAPLKILVLGGTGFIGPHMVRRARARGHTVTLFNRGRSNADLFPDLETLVGDRDGQLDALRGREWDAVIDTSGYVPRHVRDSANLLAGSVGQYLFISSVAVYANFDVPGIDEDYALATMPDPTVEEVTMASYGPMKVLAEQAVTEAFPNGATLVRPGYIVGPGDTTDRWTYWPVRMAAGGEMLAPGSPEDPMAVIDARDLASFVIHLLEQRTLGAYNALGPLAPTSVGPMLDEMKQVLGASTSLTWVPADYLEAHKVAVPIWNPTTGPYAYLHRVSHARAVAAGLTFRPLAETIAETVEWWNQQSDDRRAAMRSGLRVDPDLVAPTASLEAQMAAEASILGAWHAQAG